MIGLQWAGIVVPLAEAPYLCMGDLRSGYVAVALAAVTIGIVLHARRARYALTVATAIGGMGVLLVQGKLPRDLIARPVWPHLLSPSFEQLIARPKEMIAAIVVLTLVSVFDSLGSLVAVGTRAGLVHDGSLRNAGRSLLSVSAGTLVGGVCGTTTVVPYVESAAGVEVGGRTGLAAVVTGVLFLLSIFLHPIVATFGAPVVVGEGNSFENAGVTLHPAIAPPLILIGSLMLREVRSIPWDDPTEALPAFLMIVVMGFTVSITHGMAFGVVFYVLLKVATGRARELRFPIYVSAILFVGLYFLGLKP